MSVWFITGASRGFGLEITRQALGRGDQVATTAGATRQWAKQTNYAQPGDPVKAATVIVDLAGRENLPERIQLGEDCFTAVAQKLARTARDQDQWREISLSTGYHAAHTRHVTSGN
jgi:NAD(P)-dependent dehydrogenase (short-subunit alcohol dehydrogenase family)